MLHKLKPSKISTVRVPVSSTVPSERRNSTRLLISPCDVKPEALKCAIDEWLVPALCREFLQSKGLN